MLGGETDKLQDPYFPFEKGARLVGVCVRERERERAEALLPWNTGYMLGGETDKLQDPYFRQAL